MLTEGLSVETSRGVDVEHRIKTNLWRIAKAYKNPKDISGFSRLVSLDEIRENDYNLNPSLCVFPEPEKEEIDLIDEWEELHKIKEKLSEIDEKIENYLEELGMSK